MAEIQSAGVYIEEVASSQNVVTGVSTSNVGCVGYTMKGPTDVATLITSVPQFERVFGTDTKNSLLVKSVNAFYANGGRRAFVVRVVPSDAVAANGRIQSAVYNQLLKTGNGGTVYADASPSLSPLKDSAGATPLVPGSFTAKFRGVGATLTTVPAMARDGVTPLRASGAATGFEGRINPYKTVTLGTGTGAVTYRGAGFGSGEGITVSHINPSTANHALQVVVTGNAVVVTLATDGASAIVSTAATVAAAVNTDAHASALVTAVSGGATVAAAAAAAPLVGFPAVDPDLDVVVSGASGSPGASDVTVTWGAASLVFPGAAAGPVVTATGADGTGSFDRRTGIFSIITAVAPPINVPFTVTAVATTDTFTVTSGTTVDATGKTLLSGAALSATGISVNYVNVVDGTYSLELSAANKLHANGKLLCSYSVNAWEVQPISKGSWGNSIRLDIAGDPNWYDVATASYSKYNVNVLTGDPATNVYAVSETYEELVFDDPTSAVYFPDVLNELSDVVNIIEPGGDTAPGQLNGTAYSRSLGGGDAALSGKAFTANLGLVVSPRSVVISFVSATDGLPYTISDNGRGALTGAIDVVGTNTITYSSGALSFSTATPIKAGTLVTATYCTAPMETSHTEKLGDSTKAYSYTLTLGGAQSFYTSGKDGSFTSTTFSRNQFTAPTLIGSSKGLYALNRVDELMQVIIPDFAGDEVVSKDLLDYADSRASLAPGGDRFIILAPPKGCDPQEVVDWFRYTLGRFSKYAALYWPWVRVSDPLSNGRNLTMPPLGHIAGVYARTDATKNVGKSPGGTVDGALSYLTGLEYDSTQLERDYVYPNKVNPLISGTQTGLAVWGVRTIAIESEWRYINARRLFMFLEKSVFNSTHWTVFENNGPELWAKIKGQLTGFMVNLFNNGYFAGRSASQAFFITCDETNNPQSSIDAGQTIIDIGVAPNKPAEFIRFRFTQKAP